MSKTAPTIIRELIETITEAHDVHIYNDGDEHPEECRYCEMVKEAEEFLRLTKPLSADAINDSETLDLAHWAITYHTNSMSPRGKKWYTVSRVIKVDGRWWSLYTHPSFTQPGGIICSRTSYKDIREAALDAGIALLHGTFCAPRGPHNASEVEWSLERKP